MNTKAENTGGGNMKNVKEKKNIETKQNKRKYIITKETKKHRNNKSTKKNVYIRNTKRTLLLPKNLHPKFSSLTNSPHTYSNMEECE